MARCTLASWALLLCGCSGLSVDAQDASADAGEPSDGSAANQDGASCEPVAPVQVPRPGNAVRTPQTAGTGPCAGWTLTDVIDEIHGLRPELADITVLHDPDQLPNVNPSFIHAWLRDDVGFSVVFVRGSGDCPPGGGCSDNEYFYFATGPDCLPQYLGRYHAGYETVGTQPCVVEEGQPLWAEPSPVSAALLCGADMTPQMLEGKATVYVEGQVADCDDTGSQTLRDIAACMELRIDQQENDLGEGDVRLLGTGYPGLEQPVPAKFERRRFRAQVDEQNLDGCTPASTTLDILFDFEEMVGSVNALETVPLANCNYCKRSTLLKLTLATSH
ncbi:MAG: hypothetical protein MUF54_21030 [Polyangiaceae bacterium]|jgi:hypothetical protein|nr:hypothetical protein [Polyangiaceae bacterium]